MNLRIGNREIGFGKPAYFLAEIGLNHNGDMELAAQMIKAAARTGAEGVKFQSYRTESLADPKKNPAVYKIFKTSELSPENHQFLRAECLQAGVAFISTPFDERSAEVLHQTGIDALKIASGDLTNYPLLKTVASFRLPIIISTGMGYMDEVVHAVKILESHGAESILPLHCVSSYPPDESEMNLKTIRVMQENLKRPTGYSDHFIGELAVLGAIAMGAVLIEKHFTTNKNLPGPDQRLAADEGELRTIIEKTRMLETMLGDGVKKPSSKEEKARPVGRRGIYAAKDIACGTKIEMSDLMIARPEGEMPASRIDQVVGSYAVIKIPAGSPISQKNLAKKPERVTTNF